MTKSAILRNNSCNGACNILSKHLTKRAGFWHFARRVPQSLANLDPRGVVKQSTKIRVADDPRGVRAARAASRLNHDLEIYWRGLADGQSAESRRRYDEARKRARSFGFDYKEASSFSQDDLANLYGRLQALKKADRLSDPDAVAAVLGGEKKPSMKLSELFEEFETLEKSSLAGFSPDQVRKWRLPKKRAIANLTEVIGDKALGDISRNDALDFREWWHARILSEGLEIQTANKDFSHINKMMRTVDRRHRLDLSPVFRELRLEGGEDKQRSAYDPKFVQEQILDSALLLRLNEEARRILFVIVETGLRLSEACNLTSETIFLDAEIPLVGVALDALRAQPGGFPRYRDKSASLSGLVNAFLDDHKLRPTDKHSAYSLRHTFEDRLTAIEAPEKLIAMLMGHKYSRPRYGLGPSLAQKKKWLDLIAFNAPRTV